MLRLIFLIASFALIHSSWAQFTEISADEGIFIIQEGCLWGNGASFYDYNHDGWDDLTTADGSDFIRFYENDGNGHFQSSSINLNIAFTGQIVGVLWLDIENDGDEDLLVTQNMGRVLLFVNDGNFNFTESAVAAGLPGQSYFHYGISAADYDNDGYIDFTIAKYYNPTIQGGFEYTSRLYHNDGDGTFTDVTATCGLLATPKTTFMCSFLDYNNDGWMDIYYVVDRASWSNDLFKNNGDGTFTNVSNISGTSVFIDAMSCTVGDYDRDGDQDIFVTNTAGGNRFFKNNGDETFTNVATETGLAVNSVCWGANWLDYDNNGWDDLFIPTAVGANYTISQNLFKINNGDETFTSGEDVVGITGDIDPTFCNVIGDINNDGYYDYYNNNNDPKPCRFWRNNGGENDFVSVTLQGTISNINAIGTRINMYSSAFMQSKQVLAGESYIGQNSRKKIFGLGIDNYVDSLEIFWPSGLREVYHNIDVNTHYHLIEGNSFFVSDFIQTNDSTICLNQLITLDAGPAASWLWSDGSTERYLFVESEGEYSCVKTHEFGFSSMLDVISITLQENPVIEYTYQNPTCHNSSNGYVFLEINYEENVFVEWNTGSQNMILGSLTAGNYNCVATSTSGCSTNFEIQLIAPSPISYEYELTDVSCFGDNDGSLTILSIEGGTAPYLISVNGDANALPAGNFSLQIIDDNNCIANSGFTINEPEEISANYQVFPSIEGLPGELSITLSGGIPPFEIVINENSYPDLSYYDLPVGEYLFTAIDANGCSLEFNFTIESVLGDEEINTTENIAYPNPFTNEITLISSNIKVFNALGQEIYYVNNNKKINTTEWSSGVYLIIDDKGYSYRMIKH